MSKVKTVTPKIVEKPKADVSTEVVKDDSNVVAGTSGYNATKSEAAKTVMVTVLKHTETGMLKDGVYEVSTETAEILNKNGIAKTNK